MDAPVTRCLHCGAPRTKRWKLKDFCSYSCRGQQAVEALDGPKYQTAFVGSKNLRKTKALQSLKRASIAGIAFSKINSVTYRIDRPSKRGVGWLMEVAWPGETRQRWVARIGNHASEPLPLEEAKRAAAAMLHTRVKAEPRDWIAELNQIAANEVDRAVIQRERRKWPVDLMGGARRGSVEPDLEPDLRRAILDTEHVLIDVPTAPVTLQGDDKSADRLAYYELTYDENGYPELPACLDGCLHATR